MTTMCVLPPRIKAQLDNPYLKLVVDSFDGEIWASIKTQDEYEKEAASGISPEAAIEALEALLPDREGK